MSLYDLNKKYVLVCAFCTLLYCSIEVKDTVKYRINFLFAIYIACLFIHYQVTCTVAPAYKQQAQISS